MTNATGTLGLAPGSGNHPPGQVRFQRGHREPGSGTARVLGQLWVLLPTDGVSPGPHPCQGLRHSPRVGLFLSLMSQVRHHSGCGAPRKIATAVGLPPGRRHQQKQPRCVSRVPVTSWSLWLCWVPSSIKNTKRAVFRLLDRKTDASQVAFVITYPLGSLLILKEFKVETFS